MVEVQEKRLSGGSSHKAAQTVIPLVNTPGIPKPRLDPDRVFSQKLGKDWKKNIPFIP